MSKWQEYQLSELADVIMGQSPPSSAYNEENVGLPFLQGCAEFGDGFPIANIYCIEPKKIAPKYSVLISVRAPVGLTNKADREYIIGRGLAAIVPTNGDFNFLYYQIIQSKYKLNRVSQGSTFLAINSNDLNGLLIDAPVSLPTQGKIAQILSTADAVIEKTQAAIAKYKAIKQGMLQDLFTHGIDTQTGKLRSKYEDAPELYKESKLGWIPKEWENCKLGKYISDNLYGPRFNARDYAENGNVKTIRGTDFTKDGEILYEQAPKALLPKSLINTHQLKNGDVVVVTTADCGLTAIFEKPINDVDFIPSAYSVKFRFTDNVSPYFVKYFMATDAAIRQVNKFIRQGTLGNLPGSDILRFEMIYPESDEQIEIENRLKTIDNKIQTEQNYLQKMQQIKAGLMADLLSGKKEVNVEEETAN